MTRTVWQVYRSAVRADGDVYHFHDPELIPMGFLLRLRGKKVVYDVHEDLPRQILSKHWIPWWLRGVVAKGAELMEALAARFLDGIVAATPAIAARFPREKTVVVQNFPILSEFVVSEVVPYKERPPYVVYVGGISVIRGIFEMVKAMEHLPPNGQATLVIAGEFTPPALEEEVRKLPGWERVQFLGWQTRQQVVSLLGKARMGLVLLHPTPNYIDALPVKLFEYMAAGIPVVASDFPLWRRIVEEASCGLLVNPLDPGAIAEAITWLLEHPEEAEAMGKRGRRAVLEKYNWEKEAEKLIEFYRSISVMKHAGVCLSK